MFMLVVFTLVTGAAISYSFTSAFDDVERFGGGVRRQGGNVTGQPRSGTCTPPSTAPANLNRVDFEAIGSQSFLPVEAHQAGTETDFEPLLAAGLDQGFLTETSYGFGAMAEGLLVR